MIEKVETVEKEIKKNRGNQKVLLLRKHLLFQVKRLLFQHYQANSQEQLQQKYPLKELTN